MTRENRGPQIRAGASAGSRKPAPEQSDAVELTASVEMIELLGETIELSLQLGNLSGTV